MRELRPGQRRTIAREQHRAFYAAYISSAAWFARRESWQAEAYARLPDGAQLRCVGGCGKPWTLADDLHHVDYTRLGQEAYEDLWPMCRPCHQGLHQLFEQRSWRKLGRVLANQLALPLLQAEHHAPDTPPGAQAETPADAPPPEN